MFLLVQYNLVSLALVVNGQLVVAALVGAVGLRPTLAAIRAGRDIALANKEVMVMAGRVRNVRCRQPDAGGSPRGNRPGCRP